MGGTTDVAGTGGKQGPGGATGTTAGGTGAGGATTDTGGVTSTGGATGAGGVSGMGGQLLGGAGGPGTGGLVGTGGSALGGAGGTGTGGAAGICASPTNYGSCNRDGDFYCGGNTCCSPTVPYYCAATNRCYVTAQQAASACGSIGCVACAAPVTGTCSSSAPTGGACGAEGYLYCGEICCAPEYPYFCRATSACYATSNAAVAACGGDSCIACAPTCSEPPNVTASEVSDGICGGQPLAVIDGIPAFKQCDAALNSNVWSSTGANTASTSQGAGWVETGSGQITGNNGYQCVELTQRYFYFRFGICPWVRGYAKDMCTETLPAGVVITTTPVHGDLIVLPPGCGGGPVYGHVAVVDSVSGSTVTTAQQNSPTEGIAKFSVACATCFLHAVANGQ